MNTKLNYYCQFAHKAFTKIDYQKYNFVVVTPRTNRCAQTTGSNYCKKCDERDALLVICCSG